MFMFIYTLQFISMILAVACRNPKTHVTLLFRQVGCQAGRQEEAEIWIKTQQSSFLLSSLSLSLWMVLSVGLFQ